VLVQALGQATIKATRVRSGTAIFETVYSVKVKYQAFTREMMAAYVN
jgi:hypothetical protein